MIQPAIQQLAALGPLPDDDADPRDAVLDEYADLLAAVITPPTAEELAILVPLFGSDLCYGLAWTLLHVIETAPIAELESVLACQPAGYWIDMLRGRIAHWHQLNEEAQ